MEVTEFDVLAAEVDARAPHSSLDRVEAAMAIADELATAADDLIGSYVAQARADGCSWTEIGERLGVSKQAARQRFGPLPVTVASTPPERRLAACLEAAGREAAAAGAAEIGTDHLLIGLFHEGPAAAILEKLGARAESVRAAAGELFPGTEQPAAQPPPMSAEARDAVRGAAALARRGDGADAGPAHLLGALALDPGSRARRVLQSLGIAIPAIKRELECYISPARQRRRRRGKRVAGACSFCGKVRTPDLPIVAGPEVCICAECVGLAAEIVAEIEAAG